MVLCFRCGGVIKDVKDQRQEHQDDDTIVFYHEKCWQNKKIDGFENE